MNDESSATESVRSEQGASSLMTREMSATEVRQRLGELLDQAYYRGDRIVIKRGEKRMAALVSIQTYEQLLRQRQRDFVLLERIRAQMPTVPDERVDLDIETAVADVRAAKTERRTPWRCGWCLTPIRLSVP